jgi:hypothetical protein
MHGYYYVEEQTLQCCIERKKSTLHYAVLAGTSDDIIQNPIKAGANPKALDGNGKTSAGNARDQRYLSTAKLIEQFIGPMKSSYFGT